METESVGKKRLDERIMSAVGNTERMENGLIVKGFCFLETLKKIE